MKKNKVKLSFVLILILVNSTICAQNYKAKTEKNITKIEFIQKEHSFKLKSQSKSGVLISNSVKKIELHSKKYSDTQYLDLVIDGFQKVYDHGKPNIPVVSKSIEVPHNAKVSFNIISYREEIISLKEVGLSNLIVPAQRSVSKSKDERAIVKDKSAYSKDAYNYKEIAIYEESGFMRNTRLGRIEIRPIQYNAIKNTLRVLYDLEIEVVFEYVNDKKTEKKNEYSSPFFQNAGTINKLDNRKSLPWNTKVTYVIVSHPTFQETLQPFVAWKKQKGFHVIEAYTNNPNVGNTTTSIKNYLQNIYLNPDEGVSPPTFALLVGDVQEIPSFQSNIEEPHVTDLRYFEYTGDNIPEVYYGRFSARTIAQLQPQIDKTIAYEKFLMSDPSYLSKSLLISGVDSKYSPVYGNGSVNYTSRYYFNETNNINAYTYLYNDADNSTVMASDNNGASISIIQNINSGVGFANYTAHCNSMGWGDPRLYVNNVNSLTNDDKYGLWIGNCCQSLKFDEDVCFGEAALRKQNGGAIGVIGGSQFTYWDEDYYWAVGLKTGYVSPTPTYEQTGLGVFDAMFHTKANEINSPEKWYIAQGQFNMVGNLAVQSSTSSLKQYYWQIYHLMGDPSLVPYLGVPDLMEVEFEAPMISLNKSTFEITTAPFAYVALNQNGENICVGMADINGYVVLQIETGTLLLGEAEIVITAQNRQPFIGTIEVKDAVSLFSSFRSNLNSTIINSPIVFTDASGGGEITRWSWNFGEGALPQTANTQGPHEVVYSSLGIKTISLIVNEDNENVYEKIL
jgi:hypothetical protein